MAGDIQETTNYAHKSTKKVSYTVSVHNGGCDSVSQPKIIEGVSVYVNNPNIRICPKPAKSHLHSDAPANTVITIYKREKCLSLKKI